MTTTLQERAADAYAGLRALHHDVEATNDPDAIEWLATASVLAFHLHRRIEELLEESESS